ncbi:MAG: PspA/IM30 family protein [Myxococcota bacterium]
MGILRRISKVLESNLNSLVERAEDPGKMLEQAIDDMKKGQQEARAAIVEAKTTKRLIERKRQKAEDDAAGYERKAEMALEKGDEDLARRALELKLTAEERLNAEAEAIAEQDRQIEQLEAAEHELARRLAEMPAKRAALLARQAAAQAKGARVGASSKAQNSVHNALAAFDRMEEKVIRAEVEAEVSHPDSPELLDPGSDRRSRTDDALDQLRAKVAAKQIEAGDAEFEAIEDEEASAESAAEPEAPSADAVEDSLSALKKKLGKS